jgi:hypothetical protein
MPSAKDSGVGVTSDEGTLPENRHRSVLGGAVRIAIVRVPFSGNEIVASLRRRD